jgi:hypothetical protein
LGSPLAGFTTNTEISFLMISPHLLISYPVFLLIVSPLETADFFMLFKPLGDGYSLLCSQKTASAAHLYCDLAGCCVHPFTPPEPLAGFFSSAKTAFAVVVVFCRFSENGYVDVIFFICQRPSRVRRPRRRLPAAPCAGAASPPHPCSLCKRRLHRCSLGEAISNHGGEE